MNIEEEEGMHELYDEEALDMDNPPVFVFIPSKCILRQMIVDVLLEISMEYNLGK